MIEDTTTATGDTQDSALHWDDLQHFLRASRAVLKPEATHLYSYLLMLATQGEPKIEAPVEQLAQYVGLSARRCEAAMKTLNDYRVVNSYKCEGEFKIELLPRIRWFLQGRAQKKEGYVYLIDHGDYFKLGATHDLDTRVKQHERAHPGTARLVAKIRAESPLECEKFWHRLFGHLRIQKKREWFKLTEAEVLWFSSYPSWDGKSEEFQIQIRWEIVAYTLRYQDRIRPDIADRLFMDADLRDVVEYVGESIWGEPEQRRRLSYAQAAKEPLIAAIVDWL